MSVTSCRCVFLAGLSVWFCTAYCVKVPLNLTLSTSSLQSILKALKRVFEKSIYM